MATNLDIYNAALTMVSTERMKAENEQTAHGDAARDLLPARYEQLLSIAQWQFALKRASLSRSGDTVLGGNFDYAYELPDDMIRPVGFIVADSDDPPQEWEEEGSLIYTNQPPSPVLKYIGLVDVELIRGPFLLTLQTLLAMDLASKLRRDEALARRLNIEFKNQLYIALQTVTAFVDYPGLGFDVPTGLNSGPATGAR